MKLLQDTTVHQRTARVVLEWVDLKTIIVRAATEELGHTPPDFDVAVVHLKQQTEGSPEYPVDKWEATVSLTKNLAAK